MIIVTYHGPRACGKTTAISAAIKELERHGFICRNVGKHMGPPTPWSPVDVLFREKDGPAPLGVEVSPYAPTIIHVAAYNAMKAAADADGKVATEAEAVRDTAGYSDEFLLIKKVSPSLFSLIDTGKLDSEIALAIGRIIGAAANRAAPKPRRRAPHFPKTWPSPAIWSGTQRVRIAPALSTSTAPVPSRKPNGWPMSIPVRNFSLWPRSPWPGLSAWFSRPYWRPCR